MELNKIKVLLIACFLCSFTGTIQSQTLTKYWVRFKDKNFSPYSVSLPNAFLSQRAIDRRTTQNIAIDITDLPVNQSYINQVNATGAQVFQRSRWMNAAIVVITNAAQLNAINSLTCVLNTAPVGRYIQSGPDVEMKPTANVFKTANTYSTGYNYGPSLNQVSQIGADCMHNLGFRGQNMVIAVIDAGFDQVNVNPVFDSLRNEGRLLGTRDFVQGNSSVYEDNLHGANCLSLIAGNTPGQLIGTGPKAGYWLLRSEEVAYERIIEECNWIVAAEFADSVGADIASTSLGYTTFDIASQNHTYASLNGRTAIASIAATMAARKGMFVLNAAGNEGGGPWNYIGVPADADSICTVGSVNSGGMHSGFSSVGPTSDGRIKPDLSTMGEGSYVCAPGFSFQSGNGTSYATPILAGAVACLWQAHPNRTNMAILNALKATASKSSTPDNIYGWGIPNICAAHNYLNIYNGIEETSKTIIRLFPNPAQSQISFSLSEKVEKVQIIDVLGKVMEVDLTDKGNGHYTIELNNEMSSGLYSLSIKTSQGTV
ncbi:MAG: S8 family serine peptidase, partial [Flavitalea sp.]